MKELILPSLGTFKTSSHQNSIWWEPDDWIEPYFFQDTFPEVWCPREYLLLLCTTFSIAEPRYGRWRKAPTDPLSEVVFSSYLLWYRIENCQKKKKVFLPFYSATFIFEQQINESCQNHEFQGLDSWKMEAIFKCNAGQEKGNSFTFFKPFEKLDNSPESSASQAF